VLRGLSILLGASAVLFAGDGGDGGTDIIPRTVNFLIFVAILYYLAGDWVKNFFKNRAAAIASKLEEVHAKLRRAKEDAQKARQELEKSKELALKIAQDTEKEIEVLIAQIKKQAQEELKNLEKMFEENLELERRKRIREIVKEVLEELFDDRELTLDKRQFVDLIVKKVA